MNPRLIRELVRLRYKLFWARARTRNGRIALFLIGCLLFLLVMALVSRIGWNAAILAVRSGRARDIAGILLTAIFVPTVLASVILGFGMNEIFSDFELRRYPLGALDRHLTRNLIAMVDPFWFVVLAADAAFVVGMHLLGAASLLVGLVAVVLLFLCNYAFAQVCGLVVGRIARHRIAPVLLLAGILCIAVGSKQAPHLMARDPSLGKALSDGLQYTPAFGAATAMTVSGLAAMRGLAAIFCWLIGLCAAIALLEPRSSHHDAPDAIAIAWDTFYDRVAAWFGRRNAPLIAYWLRIYLRNTWFRRQSLLALPVVAILIGAIGKGGSRNLFIAALGLFPLATFINMDRFTVNQFGYSDSGVRRYFLLPIDPAAVLRAGSYASLLLGAPVAAVAIIGWIIWAPPPFDTRMLLMLIASSITGMLMFRGLGLWSSVLAPRKCKYDRYRMMGDPMSLSGGVVLLGSMLACLLAPGAALELAPALVSPKSWWFAPIPAILASVFYSYSLRATGALLRRRRERLIAVVEGKS